MASNIGRRKFLATLGGAAAAWPLAARARELKRVRRIGALETTSLAGLGYVEGQNLVIVYRRPANSILELE